MIKGNHTVKVGVDLRLAATSAFRPIRIEPD